MLDTLLKASRENSPIAVTRAAFDECPVMAFVTAATENLVALHIVADDINYDGYRVVRLEDVTALECPVHNAAFIEEVLAARPSTDANASDVDLHSIANAIEWAGEAFKLITIHREQDDPDVCHVGRLVERLEDRVVLQEITPAAAWEDDPTEYSLSEVTRVDFGGRYEQALFFVAGAGQNS